MLPGESDDRAVSGGVQGTTYPGFLRRAAGMVEMGTGQRERKSLTWCRVRARVGARAGLVLERRFTRSPLGEVAGQVM